MQSTGYSDTSKYAGRGGSTAGSSALALASAVGVPLDPVENISIKAAGDALSLLADDDGVGLRPGHFRRQYLAAARAPDWGGEGSICGGSCLVRVVDGQLLVVPVLCDMWACKLCGPRRAAWLKRQIAEARTRHGLVWFWTLTVWTKTATAVESFRLVSRAWNGIRGNLVRDFGPFSYVWTVEPTKRGYAHLHLLVSLDLERAELSRRWQAATGGSWVVDVQGSAGERAANYLAKYVTKQATMRRQPGWEELAGKRVFSKSRDVQFEPFRQAGEDGAEWVRWPRPFRSAVAALRAVAPVVREQVVGVPSLSVACSGGLVGGVPACLVVGGSGNGV